MKGILALLMASIMIAAIAVPMAMGDPTTSATVGNVDPTIVDMDILDASSNDMTNPSGNDLALAPGSTVTITVNALVEDLNGNDDISSVKITNVGGLAVTDTIAKTMTGSTVVSPTQRWYTATLSVQFYNPATAYTLTTVAEDTATQQDTQSEAFDVLATSPSVSVANMVYDGDPCDGASPQDFDSIAPGNAGEGKHVVTNIGNIPIDFDNLDTTGADGDDWELTGGSCTAAYWPWDGVDESAPSGWDGYDEATDEITWAAMVGGTDTIPDTEIRTNYNGENLPIGASSTMDVMFYLNTPSGLLPDTYGGTTTFTPSGV